MIKPSILVVEDDADLRDALGETLNSAGFDVTLAQDGRMALDLLDKSLPDLVLTDIQMPRMDGHTLLKHIKRRWPELPVMLITAYGTIEKAVEAMRDGAVDYLSKPFEAEVLINMVNQYIPEPVVATHEFIASDANSKKLTELASRVARSDATVMICGESGSGKEVLARYIHQHSSRADKPFVAINCAAIPDNMLEATLFGYEKGAFTGAYKACAGKFELADGGTLLLDEISEMDLGLQAKLLRVLQEREVERLGGNKLIQLDVRVLATSNRNMLSEVKRGNFREDLYYRLNVFPMHVPPLRERPNDVINISYKLIQKHFAVNGNPGDVLPELLEDARYRLLEHGWPGNVRELDNVIQRALILSHYADLSADDIQFEGESALESMVGISGDMKSDKVEFFNALSEESTSANDNSSLGEEVKQHEHRRILEALQAEMGNRKAVADKLGISERTLRYKLARMREAGIQVPNRRGGLPERDGL